MLVPRRTIRPASRPAAERRCIRRSSATLTGLRLRPVVAAACFCALAAVAPASASFPDYPGESRARWLGTAHFVLPLRGPLHERFGYDRGRLHAGIDIAVLETAAVHAALRGVVTAVGYVESYSGYGKIVKIRHDAGIETMYAHLASANVHVGEYVLAAEVIARAGCTGSCTGPHLHFEVRIRGRLVDPLRYLGRRVR